jgi:hypothetical protein
MYSYRRTEGRLGTRARGRFQRVAKVCSTWSRTIVSEPVVGKFVEGDVPRLLAPFDLSALNCSLQFLTTDPNDVEAASLSRPASTVIKFDPVTRQTTSSKRGYPNPMAPFRYGCRCPRSAIQLRATTKRFPLLRCAPATTRKCVGGLSPTA